ncbi:hypothetical protein ABI_18870 [Asticcacaulis biprosthecium C19]|uniref:Uncharacterized protein n=1 Tax=Asticcacaulis biprosthecium C19 TaxID=715226 RepID=F4QL72_9CAUL|nr:hypothetical protein ABI_18870 [Asticcacaulis biprosthecium C19]
MVGVEMIEGRLDQRLAQAQAAMVVADVQFLQPQPVAVHIGGGIANIEVTVAHDPEDVVQAYHLVFEIVGGVKYGQHGVDPIWANDVTIAFGPDDERQFAHNLQLVEADTAYMWLPGHGFPFFRDSDRLDAAYVSICCRNSVFPSANLQEKNGAQGGGGGGPWAPTPVVIGHRPDYLMLEFTTGRAGWIIGVKNFFGRGFCELNRRVVNV